MLQINKTMNKLKYLLLLIPAIGIFFFSSFNNNQTEKKTTENIVWQTDMKIATEMAKKEDKPLLLFFTGSDWCGWCIRLQKEVLKTPEFEAWAKEKVILVELDFPRRTEQSVELKTQNGQLQQAFGIQGFPTVWFAKAGNKDGKVNLEQLGSTGYVAGGPAAWLAGANDIVAKYTPNKMVKTAKLKKAKA